MPDVLEVFDLEWPEQIDVVFETPDDGFEIVDLAAPILDVTFEGPAGPGGDAATIAVGDVTTVAPTTPADVENVGTPSAAVFDFEIPKGDKGDQGIQGPIGPPGGAFFVHEQMVASSVWLIVHNLGLYPAVVITDTAGRQIYGDILYLDLNTVQLTFSTAISGRADLV